VDYFVYQYRFDDGAILPLGVARNVTRQGIMAHISVWAPVYTRLRRTNASR
jgi:hypothetical protein